MNTKYNIQDKHDNLFGMQAKMSAFLRDYIKERKNTNLYHLAKELDLSYDFLKKMLSGDLNCTLDTLVQIFQKIGYEVDITWVKK